MHVLHGAARHVDAGSFEQAPEDAQRVAPATTVPKHAVVVQHAQQDADGAAAGVVALAVLLAE